MALTLDQLVEEARHLPAEQVAELVDRLSQELHLDADIEESWKTEVRQRLADIETGRVHSVSGPEVSAKVRKIVGR